eukprot:364989-Chlamydomonas_euryale.AAC.10
MLEIFHETSDVFMLKDVEKLSSKKGIISQSVKEVLQVATHIALFQRFTSPHAISTYKYNIIYTCACLPASAHVHKAVLAPVHMRQSPLVASCASLAVHIWTQFAEAQCYFESVFPCPCCACLTQSLVDDDLVSVERIGISNYYWSFPSEASVKVGEHPSMSCYPSVCPPMPLLDACCGNLPPLVACQAC